MPDVTDRSWFANTATFERFQPFGRVRDNEGSPKVGELQLVGRDTETRALVRCDAQRPDCRQWAHATTHPVVAVLAAVQASACREDRRARLARL
jgi:hypothetical protein